MKKPPIPINEQQRLKALHGHEILDTAQEEYFNNIVGLASTICDTPISLISLVDRDRQWFKAKVGLEVQETPRDISFCGHAINQDEIFLVEDATKDERFSDNPLVSSDPRVVFYAGYPIKDQQGYNLGTLCVIDHKPKKLTSEQIQQLKILSEQASLLVHLRNELNQKYKNAILLDKTSENLPGFVYTYKLNPDGTSCFPYSTNQIYQIYEVHPHEVAADASKVFERIHSEDLPNIKKTIMNSAETMTTWTCDYRVVLPQQGMKWVRGNANPEKLKDGSILWHGYISDITELKEKEQTLYHNQKLATLGEMAASIAHEINNPITIIKVSAFQMRNGIERKILDEGKLNQYLTKIEETTERISKIIRGLSFFSKKAENEFKEESLEQIIQDTIAICAEKFKIGLVDIDICLPKNINSLHVKCHAVEISQVILNLLNNAYDAISDLPKKWVKIEVVESGDNLIVSVIDSGSGIPASIASKILHPFYTTKAAGKGTGLGLTISQRIIEAHAGAFWIDTNYPNTKFSFTLPKYKLPEIKSA